MESASAIVLKKKFEQYNLEKFFNDFFERDVDSVRALCALTETEVHSFCEEIGMRDHKRRMLADLIKDVKQGGRSLSLFTSLNSLTSTRRRVDASYGSCSANFFATLARTGAVIVGWSRREEAEVERRCREDRHILQAP